jgi:hypothetical protein
MIHYERGGISMEVFLIKMYDVRRRNFMYCSTL